jgi:hypothetical protein
VALSREETANLSSDDKHKIWVHYYINYLGLKHRFYVRDLTPAREPIVGKYGDGWGKLGAHDKVFRNIEFRYLWKNLRYDPYEKWDDEQLYQWYWMFEKEINL